jgi:hypothetical protein
MRRRSGGRPMNGSSYEGQHPVLGRQGGAGGAGCEGLCLPPVNLGSNRLRTGLNTNQAFFDRRRGTIQSVPKIFS